MKFLEIKEKTLEEEWKKYKKKIMNDLKNGTVHTITINLEKMIKKRPTIKFVDEAWHRMMALVKSCEMEIAWHATVTRQNETDFLIDKIYLYPQHASGALVDPTDEEYASWSMKLKNEEVNRMRFQGHSHVNMGTTPSSIDDRYYAELLQQIRYNKGDFYIFMILNKRSEYFINLYDYKRGVLFEKSDINIEIVKKDGSSYKEWAEKEIKEKVKHLSEKPESTPIIPLELPVAVQVKI
jgi:hypothetical protein